jgi:hypothetical protein
LGRRWPGRAWAAVPLDCLGAPPPERICQGFASPLRALTNSGDGCASLPRLAPGAGAGAAAYALSAFRQPCHQSAPGPASRPTLPGEGEPNRAAKMIRGMGTEKPRALR